MESDAIFVLKTNFLSKKWIQRLTFSENVKEGSYLPPMGLAAAMMAQRAWSEVTIPAFDTEILCCSIASWMLVRSASFIWNESGNDEQTRGYFILINHLSSKKLADYDSGMALISSKSSLILCYFSTSFQQENRLVKSPIILYRFPDYQEQCNLHCPTIK